MVTLEAENEPSYEEERKFQNIAGDTNHLPYSYTRIPHQVPLNRLTNTNIKGRYENQESNAPPEDGIAFSYVKKPSLLPLKKLRKNSRRGRSSVDVFSKMASALSLSSGNTAIGEGVAKTGQGITSEKLACVSTPASGTAVSKYVPPSGRRTSKTHGAKDRKDSRLICNVQGVLEGKMFRDMKQMPWLCVFKARSHDPFLRIRF